MTKVKNTEQTDKCRIDDDIVVAHVQFTQSFIHLHIGGVGAAAMLVYVRVR